jgi:hypothetical protein
MAKQVQKTSSKNLKLYIISTIKNRNKLPDDVKKNVCSYHLKPFLKAGIVHKKGYGVWEITKKGELYLNKKELQKQGLVTSTRVGKTTLKKKIRGHGFKFKFKLPSRAFYSPEKRMKVCHMGKLSALLLHNKNIKITIRDHIVHLGLRTVCIYFNKELSFMGGSASKSYKEALFEAEKVFKRIEKIYGVNLKIRGNYRFKIFGQHYGDLENAFAIKCQRNKQFVRVFDEGKEWLIIDFSDNAFREMETVQNDRAKYDMDYIITPFMNKLHKDPKILDKVENKLLRMEKIIERQNNIIEVLVNKQETGFNNGTFYK